MYIKTDIFKIKRIKIVSLILIFFLSSLFIKSSSETESTNSFHNIDRELIKSLLLTPEVIEKYSLEFTEVLKKHNFRGNILIAVNGKVLFEESSGYADINNRIPNNIHTAFQLASISKTFTAAAVCLLQEMKLLKYDDLVKKYIPEFPYDNISIRHLLSHTSGVQNYIWLLDNHWHKPYFPNNEDLIDLFALHKLPLNFIPGSRFSYSNTGYAILGSLIERISGKKYDVFMKEYIFAPLEMNNTFAYNKSILDTISNKAHGHVLRGRGYVVYNDDNNDGILGDKGIYSTLYDLYKWDLALYSDILLSQEAISTLFEKQVTLRSDSIYYGLGWRLPKTETPKMVYHNGWWHGYRSTLRRFTNEKNTLIILNNTNMNIYPMIKDIQTVFYEGIEID